MRILHVINSLEMGGAEKLVLHSVPRYNAAGISAEVLLLKRTNSTLYTALKESGCRIFDLGTSSVYNPMHIFRLKKFLKQYDLVHVHLFPGLYWAAMAKYLVSGSPGLIYTEHNTTNRRRDHFLLKRLDRWVYKRFDKLVTISDDVDRQLKAHLKGRSDSDFIRIPNGIDLNEIDKATPYDRNEFSKDVTERLLLQVASFTEQKDQETLIKAVAQCETPVRLLLVGVGEKVEACKNLASELGILDRVEFLRVRDDVPRLLKTVDAVVLSTHFEGLSLSCLEGMASGKPFIASAAPGLSTIVEGHGLLFPIGDATTLARLLDRVLTDEELARETADNCKARAEEFSIENTVDAHLKLYKSICKD